MSDKTYFAIISTPLGVWEDTATVCSGHEAEYRAKRIAWRKFMQAGLPPFMTKSTDYLIDVYSQTARVNGCECISKEIEINSKPVQ